MKPYQIRKAALEMGISPVSAINMRLRYLGETILRWADVVVDEIDTLPAETMFDALHEAVYLKQYLKAINKPKDGITDEMIERARDVPIETLIEFDRNGKALAWCHDDKTPSLTWFKKGNRATCFVCDRRWNSIDICMDRDGLSFAQAVKQLGG